MKKVLIADDELLVRIGLKSTIPWEENGFTVVGEAKNGKECIEIFDKVDPDILLTDIRMPIINGLELIQILKKKKSTLKAIILTHYDDFNYAKEAIRLGASEYILKPDLSSEHLLTILKKLSCEIDNTSKMTNALLKDHLHEGSLSKISTQSLLEDIIYFRYADKNELQTITKKLDKVLLYKYSLIAYASIRSEDSVNLGNNKKVIKSTVENIVGDVFNDNTIQSYIVTDKNNIAYFFNIKDTEGKSETLARMHNLLTLLKRNMHQFLDIDMEMGISDITDNVQAIPEIFDKAVKSQRLCFFEDSGIALYTEKLNSISNGECPKISVNTLRNYIRAHDMDELSNYIDLIFNELAELKKIEYVRYIFNDFVSYAKIIYNELNISNSQLLSDSRFSYSNIEKLSSFQMVKAYIHNIYSEFIYISKDSNSPHKYSYAINKCMDYIKNNYSRNISLSDVADYVEMSKCYLSFLFKEETGINFSNYLINYRIEKSKKLLMESNLKMYEIAEKVGFDNPYYFSKVFKDITGLSCKEFKKLNYS